MEAAHVMAAGLLVLACAAVWLLIRCRKTTEEAAETVDRLARGELGARMGPERGEAGRRLAESVNRLADGLQKDLTQLKRLDEMRREFVANVSHEIKTPLASIKAYAETLSGGGVAPQEAREFAGEIERSADRLSRLVDGLLELSALDSGQRPPNRQPFSLMRVAAEVTAGLMPLAQRRGIVIRQEPLHGLPAVLGDQDQIKRVLLNLLDNAVKFTGDNGTVRLWAEAVDGEVRVFVQDTGIGIPASDLPRVFDRFYRVDKARSRELGGTGLGLSIVKQLVEAHGGAVGVESAPGKGSTFHVNLPAAS